MTDREALTRAVCGEPWDDTRRLAFADWLDENGEPGRAYLIRHGGGVYRSPPGMSCQADFWERGQGPRQTLELASPVPDLSYVATRGFVCGIICSWPAFWVNAKTLFRNHPITRVEITDKVPRPEGPRTWQWLTMETTELPIGVSMLNPEMRHHFQGQQNKKIQKVKNHAKVLRRFSYPTAKAAVEALSDAAVRYGRWLVGLPREYEPRGVPGLAGSTAA